MRRLVSLVWLEKIIRLTYSTMLLSVNTITRCSTAEPSLPCFHLSKHVVTLNIFGWPWSILECDTVGSSYCSCVLLSLIWQRSKHCLRSWSTPRLDLYKKTYGVCVVNEWRLISDSPDPGQAKPHGEGNGLEHCHNKTNHAILYYSKLRHTWNHWKTGQWAWKTAICSKKWLAEDWKQRHFVISKS